jgi:hypothetical protein
MNSVGGGALLFHYLPFTMESASFSDIPSSELIFDGTPDMIDCASALNWDLKAMTNLLRSQITERKAVLSAKFARGISYMKIGFYG